MYVSYSTAGKVVEVSYSAIGGAVYVGYSTAGRAVEVDCNAIVGQQGIGLTIRGISQRSGGSTVPASDGR